MTLPLPITYNLTCAINGCLLRQVIFHGITLENNKKHTFKLVSHLGSNNESNDGLIQWSDYHFYIQPEEKYRLWSHVFENLCKNHKENYYWLTSLKTSIICYWAKWPVLFAPIKLEKNIQQLDLLRLIFEYLDIFHLYFKNENRLLIIFSISSNL